MSSSEKWNGFKNETKMRESKIGGGWGESRDREDGDTKKGMLLFYKTLC